MTEEGRRYDLVEVTADVAIKARGHSLPELFANAAWGLMDLICDSATVSDSGSWDVHVESADPEGLMVDFLTELLVLFETEGVLLSSLETQVEGGPPYSLRATVHGEIYDPSRHELLHDIKAVTYHTLEVRPEEGWARVLFDI
jgi:SHS2 domain-containing protein